MTKRNTPKHQPSTHRRWLTAAALMAALVLAALPASAGLENEMMRHLVAPEMLMRFADDIGLSEAQRQAITAAIQGTQADATEIQWQLQAASRALIESIAGPSIDREEALTRARAVMELEQKVKLRHLSLLIEIRSQLRPEQVERLRELRAQ